MKTIKCLFCSKQTTFHRINAQKKIRNKVVTISNSPVFFCSECKETFLSSEAQEVFSFVRDRGLDAKGIMFNFDQLVKEFDMEDIKKDLKKYSIKK